LDELPVLNGLEKERALHDEEKFRKEKVLSDLERASWRQKLRRDIWLKESDKCIKFFHRVANLNRRNNSIESLSVNGSISFDRTVTWDHIVHFYGRLLWNNLIGGPRWIALLLIPLMRRRPLGYSNRLRRVRYLRWWKV
jgi:hypothetical protein